MARERAFVICLLLVLRVWMSAVFLVQATVWPGALKRRVAFLL